MSVGIFQNCKQKAKLNRNGFPLLEINDTFEELYEQKSSVCLMATFLDVIIHFIKTEKKYLS